MYDFVKGLQPWAQQEVRMRKPKTFAEAVSIAESLLEIKNRNESSKPKGDFKGKGGGDRNQKGQEKATFNSNGRKERQPLSCYFCGGPHVWRECPKRQTLNALLEAHETTQETHMSSLCLLNALNIKPIEKSVPKNGLMYVEVSVQGQPTLAMLDTRASHNFMAEDEARRLGLPLKQSQGSLKTVNAAPQPLLGMVKNVSLVVGTWQGTVDFTVVPLDDFKVVLGMEFFRQAKAVPTPHLQQIVILEEKTPCMVPARIQTKGEAKLLSAMQIDKGLRRGEVTYLAK